MVEQSTWGRRLFVAGNHTFLIIISFLCVFPLLNILAMSLSSSTAIDAGKVGLWPVDFTLDAYRYVLNKREFFQALLITVQRVLLGVSINTILTVLLSYPLSKDAGSFRYRTGYVWICVFTMLTPSGLIPLFMTVKYTGIMDSIWALVLPGAVPVFNILVLLNFFRSLPREMSEAAFMDGATHYRLLWSIYIPLSVPALTTITLFATVYHWNAWFDGIIFMNSPAHYPLQSYLRTVILQNDLDFSMMLNPKLMYEINERSSKLAQIFVGALPILLLYPFLQRFFISGIVLGGVKE